MALLLVLPLAPKTQSVMWGRMSVVRELSRPKMKSVLGVRAGLMVWISEL